MAGLLDLPLELREPILLEVVAETTQQQPARVPSLAGLGNGYRRVESDEWDPTFCKSLKRHAMPLLHINQQIRAEVIDFVLRKLGQRIGDAKVDVIYRKETKWGPSTLWATWLSAPFPTYHLHTLHAQIRQFQVFRTVISQPHTPVSLMEDCKDWIDPESAEMLLNFVAKSLRARAGNASIHEGQGLAAPQGSRLARRTIQKLVINIPVDADAGYSRGARIRCMQCSQDIHQVSRKKVCCMIPSGKRAALVFASSLHEQLLRIVGIVPKFCRDNNLSTSIFESVGTIDLNVDGRLFRSLNLSQIFANLPCDEQWFGFGFSRVEFFEWKRAAEDERKAAGFELVRPSVQEHELTGSAGLIASILAARDESLGREVILPSDDDTPSARQPATHEQFFIGNALLVQDNGSMVAGDATFYYSELFIWVNTLQYLRPPAAFPPLDHHQPDPSFSGLSFPRKVIDKQALGDRPRDGELVMFKGETILFSAVGDRETITSGDATFYGRAETASTERSSSTKAVFQDARDHHDASDI